MDAGLLRLYMKNHIDGAAKRKNERFCMKNRIEIGHLVFFAAILFEKSYRFPIMPRGKRIKKHKMAATTYPAAICCSLSIRTPAGRC